jgi:hypothetical protein
MPYSIGAKGSYGCSGYPVVKEDGEVMGCHQTREKAQAQMTAINISESQKFWEGSAFGKAKKPNYGGVISDRKGEPADKELYARVIAEAKRKFDVYPSAYANGWVVQEYKRRGGTYKVYKAEYGDIKEGDYVMGMTADGVAHGRVEHIMWEGGTLGTPGTEYALESMPPENPAMSVRIYEDEDDGNWEPTPYSIGMMYQDATKLESLEGHEMPEDDDMYEDVKMMSKAETYQPTSGMKTAAERALRWKKEGKATGAGTPVGWGRATDIAAGRSMSLSVVKRMYSFFSRHEVDKKGKDFYNLSNPSNGRIMWDAWGGDAGFSWSRSIVEREKKKTEKFWQGSAFSK